jgi:hypothetical protein
MRGKIKINNKVKGETENGENFSLKKKKKMD